MHFFTCPINGNDSFCNDLTVNDGSVLGVFLFSLWIISIKCSLRVAIGTYFPLLLQLKQYWCKPNPLMQMLILFLKALYFTFFVFRDFIPSVTFWIVFHHASDSNILQNLWASIYLVFFFNASLPYNTPPSLSFLPFALADIQQYKGTLMELFPSLTSLLNFYLLCVEITVM